MSETCACRHLLTAHGTANGRPLCFGSPTCGCGKFRRQPAPRPSAEEQAVLHRIENTRPAPESYRPDDEEPPVTGKASIPDHLRTDTVHDYLRQKGEL